MNLRIWSTAASAALAVVTSYACSPSSDSTPADGSRVSDAGAVALLRDDADEIPCEPRQVLVEICQQCHTRPMRNGAPFPLQRRSDVLAMYEGSVIRDDMIAQLEARRMPLTPVTIDDARRDVLLSWLRAGAPAVAPTSCRAAPDAGTDAAAHANPPPPEPLDAGTVPDADIDAAQRDAGP